MEREKNQFQDQDQNQEEREIMKKVNILKSFQKLKQKLKEGVNFQMEIKVDYLLGKMTIMLELIIF